MGSKAARKTWLIRPEQSGELSYQFAAQLAERGYITYAPQNPYIFEDRFRTLQRKGNPLEQVTLFDHRAAARADRRLAGIARRLSIPSGLRSTAFPMAAKRPCACRPIVERLLPVDLLGRFQRVDLEEHLVAVALQLPVHAGEYEMFEFDLGNTFNYAEMAGLIAPRPFMVERGHRDGVAPDEWVAYEYAKVRLSYADLKIPERTTIEFFDGPHEIHSVGTFAFLHQQLR